MTKAAQHYGKKLDNFFATQETLDYVEAAVQIPGNPGNMVVTNRGRYGGTWAHPKLAVFFARWLDVLGKAEAEFSATAC
jgi:hypothetical protein